MMPGFLTSGGPMIWLILIASAMAIGVFIERFLYYHREQINSSEFLNGVRNILKRDNVIEALAICDATPGPVARLVKVAILNRDRGREGVRESLEDAGFLEVPRLEEKLNFIATIAQISPIMGLLGTVLGLMRVFGQISAAGLLASDEQLARGVKEALICTAAGLAVSIPSYAAYNYLVARVNSIVLDMEQASTEILNIVSSPASTAAP